MNDDKVTPQFYKEISTLVEKYVSTNQDALSQVFAEMKLLENPRFKAFIVDVAVNTCDLSRREYLPNYEVSHLD